MEPRRIEDTEVEWERVDALVKEAYRQWCENPTSTEAEERMNWALEEAFATGVRIAVRGKPEALNSPAAVNQELFDKLKAVDSRLREEIVISSIKENPRLTQIYRGNVIATRDSGFLFINVTIRDKSLYLANFKPEEIVSLTPLSPNS